MEHHVTALHLWASSHILQKSDKCLDKYKTVATEKEKQQAGTVQLDLSRTVHRPDPRCQSSPSSRQKAWSGRPKPAMPSKPPMTALSTIQGLPAPYKDPTETLDKAKPPFSSSHRRCSLPRFTERNNGRRLDASVAPDHPAPPPCVSELRPGLLRHLVPAARLGRVVIKRIELAIAPATDSFSGEFRRRLQLQNRQRPFVSL